MKIKNVYTWANGGAEANRKVKKRQRSSMWPKLFQPVSNIILVVVFIAWSESCTRQTKLVDGFVLPYSRYTNSRWSEMAADSNHNGQDEKLSSSLSNSVVRGITKRKGSRLQVRRRVKAVLEKARVRTGVRNGSVTSSPPPPPRPTPTVVAEAATIGGLGDGAADIIFTEVGKLSAIGTTNTTAESGEEMKNEPSTNNTNLIYFPEEGLGLGEQDVLDVNYEQKPSILKTNTSASNGHADLKIQTAEVGTTDIHTRKPKDFDVIRGDMPSANAFVEPLPFKLPSLSSEQKKKLFDGERIQEQSRMGREGSGYVVLDVEAPPYIVWECLLDFESYPELIPTVKSMQLYTSTKLNTGFKSEKPVLPGTGRETRHYGTPSITRASFILSKFRLNIAAIHRYTPHPRGDYMEFTLDPSCTNVVLKGAKGTWYTEENPDGREGFTRVYLLAGLQISRALPKFIVDYAAERAMPRATKWIRPEVEALKQEWDSDDLL